MLGYVIIHEEGLRHGPGVGYACGFYHDAIKMQTARALFFGQRNQSNTQIIAYGAAHAAVAHLDDLLAIVRNQYFVINGFFAKFVFDNGDFLPVRFG